MGRRWHNLKVLIWNDAFGVVGMQANLLFRRRYFFLEFETTLGRPKADDPDGCEHWTNQIKHNVRHYQVSRPML